MKSWSLHRRWDRAGRLLGEDAMARLYGAHVMVFGLGGVGSFTAESLARTGVGKLTLVDFDRVCGTNTNRQLHAMKGTFGKWKADLMAERCALINPEGTVIGRRAFYHEATSESFLGQRPDFVVDAIDNVSAKVHLLTSCLEQGIEVVSCMGAAGKADPTKIEIDDLARTKGDPLARAVRKILRQNGVMKGKGRVGIPTVYSSEVRHQPQSLSYDGTAGFRCICPTKGNELHSCDHRNLIEGTVSFVTGTFGMMAASVVVRELCAQVAGEAAAE
ncbi:tRNA threonylcarbamoyladenosine dehydratase [Lujinxingia litoralis]|uniref:tRNA threonylcarbamoyladenosine dehydratase n=2 Tax=Lujinxingia litoralis TaxID=2211119 RepID=A0A328CA40_9DELT|nr:tRNA threonylcarbamoyladenosine dehydratase [Lujinxingia litoralis]